MYIGHYSPALIIKKFEPKIPLWFLFICTQLVDVAWSLLVILEIEKVRIINGFTKSNPLDLYYMPYSHSLLATFGWGILSWVGYKYFKTKNPWQTSFLVGVAVSSHWFLDLIVHVRDLPIYGDNHKVGLALWNHPYISLSLEVALVTIPFILISKHKMKKMVPILTLLISSQLYSLFGPLPISPKEMAATTLFSYILFSLVTYIFFDRKKS